MEALFRADMSYAIITLLYSEDLFIKGHGLSHINLVIFRSQSDFRRVVKGINVIWEVLEGIVPEDK